MDGQVSSGGRRRSEPWLKLNFDSLTLITTEGTPGGAERMVPSYLGTQCATFKEMQGYLPHKKAPPPAPLQTEWLEPLRHRSRTHPGYVTPQESSAGDSRDLGLGSGPLPLCGPLICSHFIA